MSRHCNKHAKSAQTLRLAARQMLIEIDLKQNARAKHYTLRLPPYQRRPVLTMPRGSRREEALQFARDHIDWLIERLALRPEHIALRPGVLMPFRGVEHQLVAGNNQGHSVGCLRGVPHPLLEVSGSPDRFAHSLTRWLKGQARFDLSHACARHAAKLGLSFRSLAVRDPKTRWGSCSSNGRLNFSWRLILAPSGVLNYVAAHEVAHLQEMNHQAAFWALVQKTCPDMEVQRDWLRAHGGYLHSFG